MAPSEEAVSPQYCRYNDDAFFPEHDLTEDNSIADEDENENPSDIAKIFLDKISQEIAEIDTKKRPQPWKRSRSVPTKIDDLEKSEDRVFRMTDAPTSRDDSGYPSIKHTASESTQSTTSLSFDEDEQDDHEDEQEGPIKPISILRRKAKLAEVTIEASGAGVRFVPSTVFLERASGKRKPLRRKPRIQVQVQTYTEDELRRMARRSKQNQYSRHELQFSHYLTNDIRSPSSEILSQTESFYVFR